MTNEEVVTVADDVVGKVDVEPKYFGNVLSSFENGVQLDLRVKLAVDFLKSPYFQHAHRAHVVADPLNGAPLETLPDPRADAAHALDLASALIEEAAARGLMKALPDTGEISATLRHHVERSVRVNAHGQIVGNRIMREESGAVVPAGASMMHPGFAA